MDAPIGLIAGQGRLPVISAQGIRSAGRNVACVGLAGQFDQSLPDLCTDFKTAGIAQMGRWIRLLKKWGVREAVMVGRVSKMRLYDPMCIFRYLPDLRAAKIFFGTLRRDRRNDALLGAVSDELAKEGITLIDSTKYIPEFMAEPGVMTKTRPSGAIQADIAFGVPIVQRMGDLDIGQAIAIKNKDVIAVEAIEGTDRMIKRSGELCPSGGWVLIKMGKPDQDMRFDVPTIGMNTIRGLKENKAKCLAVEADKVILIDKPELIREADKLGISIVGVTADQFDVQAESESS